MLVSRQNLAGVVLIYRLFLCRQRVDLDNFEVFLIRFFLQPGI